jgi:hypothetical protein
MTSDADLLDYFAGIALAGEFHKVGWPGVDQAGLQAYEYADSMLRARKNYYDLKNQDVL